MTKMHTQPCSVSAALNIFGDAWTLIVVREALYGTSRFRDFRRATGIAKNLLSDRLNSLVAEDILERINIGKAGERYEYRLTPKGEALSTVLVAIIQWSDQWVYGAGKEPLIFRHARTGETLGPMRATWPNGEIVNRATVAATPGPGANQAIRDRFGAGAWSPPRKRLQRQDRKS